MPKKSQLFVDLDGVLADMDGHYQACFGSRLDRNAIDPPGMWENILSRPQFFMELPVIHDALELWSGILALHQSPIILTGIRQSVYDCGQQKTWWVKEHISAVPQVVCCKSSQKYLHGKPGDVLVDDWKRYQKKWEDMGGIFVLHHNAAATLSRLREIYR